MRKLIYIILLLRVSLSVGAELQTKVQYVSATTVYLDAGRGAGIEQGDTVVVTRDGEEIARMVVSFVADNSASCEFADAATFIKKDDSAIVHVTHEIKSELPVEEAAAPVAAYEARTIVRPSERANNLTGRIGFEYTLQDDHEPVNYDYTEPALNARVSLNRINGSDFSARVNLRLRKTIRSNDTPNTSSNRIYEALLAYVAKDKPFAVVVGRQIPRETRGMGYLDGAYVRYEVASNWKIGAVGGLEPDLQNTRIQSDVTKYGAFAAFDTRMGESSSLQATASLAGRYLDGEVSREFFYQQINYAYGTKFRIFESTELNLNRDWLKDAEGSSTTLASLLLDARYNVSRSLGIAVGYDNRKNYYTAETRTIPDSIFAHALQQGFRASVDTRFGKGYSAEVGVGLRDGDAESARATSGWVRLGTIDLAKSSVDASARLRWFDSEYSTGTQPSLLLTRDMTRWLTTGVEVGANSYEITSNSEKISQQWVAFILDFDFARSVYAATELELGFGDGRDVTLLNLGLGYRF